MISFGAFLVHSLLSLYTRYSLCTLSTFLVYSVLFLYTPSMLHSLVLLGYYVMTKGALKPCLWRKVLAPRIAQRRALERSYLERRCVHVCTQLCTGGYTTVYTRVHFYPLGSRYTLGEATPRE